MSLRSDTRAVAPVLGAVLLFGITVVAFSGYQATVVPNQNAEVEHNHFQEVKDQMVAFRALMYSAAQTNSIRTASIDLGTHYPARLFGINPPPAAGTLATSDTRYDLTISKVGKSAEQRENESIPIRILTYSPGYSEFRPGPIVYEHGLLYLSSSAGSTILLPDQSSQPILENNTLRIVATQDTTQHAGTTATSVDISLIDSYVDGEVTVTPGNGAENDNKKQEATIHKVELPTYLTRQQWESTGVTIEKYDSRANAPNRVTIDTSGSVTVEIYLVKLD